MSEGTKDTKTSAKAAAEDPARLTEQEIEQLRAKARENVHKEARAAALKKQLEQFEKEERIAAGLAGKPEPRSNGRWPDYGPPPHDKEDEVQVTIALPPFCDHIRVDGRIFFDGHTEWVSPSVYASLIEQMQWSWSHQDVNNIQSPHDKHRVRTRGRDANLITRPVVRGTGAVN